MTIYVSRRKRCCTVLKSIDYMLHLSDTLHGGMFLEQVDVRYEHNVRLTATNGVMNNSNIASFSLVAGRALEMY